MRRLPRLLRDCRGSTLLEFGLLAPAMFAMMLGVFQIGMGMQAYNAMRSVASDTARAAATSYQRENEVPQATIRNTGIAIATAAPYSLKPDELTLVVEQAGDQRVDGAIEFTITIDYRVPSILGFIGIDAIPLSYTRPIFVIEPEA
jgi:Flp pilus assembly protein TadG